MSNGGAGRPPGMFKVAFDLEQVSENWPPFDTERIWAKKASAPYQLELQNIPFFVRGISRGDIIRARPDHERRELVFDGLVSHSGSSTVRLILRDKSSIARERVLEFFRVNGCEWEFSTIDFHLAVDIPPAADYPSLRESLVAMVDSGVIEVEESWIDPGHLA